MFRVLGVHHLCGEALSDLAGMRTGSQWLGKQSGFPKRAKSQGFILFIGVGFSGTEAPSDVQCWLSPLLSPHYALTSKHLPWQAPSRIRLNQAITCLLNTGAAFKEYKVVSLLLFSLLSFGKKCEKTRSRSFNKVRKEMSALQQVVSVCPNPNYLLPLHREHWGMWVIMKCWRLWDYSLRVCQRRTIMLKQSKEKEASS